MYFYIQKPYHFFPQLNSIQDHLWSSQETPQNNQFNEHFHQDYAEWHNKYNRTLLTSVNNSEIERQWSLPSIPTPSWPSIPTPSLPSIPTPSWPTIPTPSWPTIPTSSWPSTSSLCPGYTGYKTNKFDLKHDTESGGWIVGWADDIAEKDVAQGIVSVGVSIFSSNPAPFYAWVKYLVDRTISSLSYDVQQKFTGEIKNQLNQITADIISRAIQGKSTQEVLRKYRAFDFKAGAIRYSGKNMLCGNTVSTTWGMKPYLAFRIR